MMAAFHMMLQPMEDLLNLTCPAPFNSCVCLVKQVAFSHGTTKKVEIQWDRDLSPGCTECIQRQKMPDLKAPYFQFLFLLPFFS